MRDLIFAISSYVTFIPWKLNTSISLEVLTFLILVRATFFFPPQNTALESQTTADQAVKVIYVICTLLYPILRPTCKFSLVPILPVIYI